MFFTPRHIKEGKHYRHALKRLIHYKRDILAEKDLVVLRDLLARLKEALKSRKREQIYGVRDEIEKAVGRIAPPPKDVGWRENVEVFLVAIVIAAGVRAYFLQPFKIPTGSMQPTLFGIVGTPTATSPPNPLTRAVQLVWLGRHSIDVTAKEG
jgi:signal peptidase I